MKGKRKREAEAVERFAVTFMAAAPAAASSSPAPAPAPAPAWPTNVEEGGAAEGEEEEEGDALDSWLMHDTWQSEATAAGIEGIKIEQGVPGGAPAQCSAAEPRPAGRVWQRRRRQAQSTPVNPDARAAYEEERNLHLSFATNLGLHWRDRHGVDSGGVANLHATHHANLERLLREFIGAGQLAKAAGVAAVLVRAGDPYFVHHTPDALHLEQFEVIAELTKKIGQPSIPRQKLYDFYRYAARQQISEFWHGHVLLQLARYQMECGDHKEAYETLRPLVSVPPYRDDPQANLLCGLALHHLWLTAVTAELAVLKAQLQKPPTPPPSHKKSPSAAKAMPGGDVMPGGNFVAREPEEFSATAAAAGPHHVEADGLRAPAQPPALTGAHMADKDSRLVHLDPHAPTGLGNAVENLPPGDVPHGRLPLGGLSATSWPQFKGGNQPGLTFPMANWGRESNLHHPHFEDRQGPERMGGRQGPPGVPGVSSRGKEPADERTLGQVVAEMRSQSSVQVAGANSSEQWWRRRRKRRLKRKRSEGESDQEEEEDDDDEDSWQREMGGQRGTILYREDLSADICPFKLPKDCAGYAYRLPVCGRHVSELGHSAEYLSKSLEADPTCIAALLPLVQLMVAQGAATSALRLCRACCRTNQGSSTSIVYLHLLECMSEPHPTALVEASAGLLWSSPSLQDAAQAICRLHSRGACGDELAMEALALHLDVAPGSADTWCHLAESFLALRGRAFGRIGRHKAAEPGAQPAGAAEEREGGRGGQRGSPGGNTRGGTSGGGGAVIGAGAGAGTDAGAGAGAGIEVAASPEATSLGGGGELVVFAAAGEGSQVPVANAPKQQQQQPQQQPQQQVQQLRQEQGQGQQQQQQEYMRRIRKKIDGAARDFLLRLWVERKRPWAARHFRADSIAAATRVTPTLAHKAAAAAHLLGPQNSYTCKILTLVEEASTPSPAPGAARGQLATYLARHCEGSWPALPDGMPRKELHVAPEAPA